MTDLIVCSLFQHYNGMFRDGRQGSEDELLSNVHLSLTIHWVSPLQRVLLIDPVDIRLCLSPRHPWVSPPWYHLRQELPLRETLLLPVYGFSSPQVR